MSVGKNLFYVWISWFDFVNFDIFFLLFFLQITCRKIFSIVFKWHFVLSSSFTMIWSKKYLEMELNFLYICPPVFKNTIFISGCLKLGGFPFTTFQRRSNFYSQGSWWHSSVGGTFWLWTELSGVSTSGQTRGVRNQVFSLWTGGFCLSIWCFSGLGLMSASFPAWLQSLSLMGAQTDRWFDFSLLTSCCGSFLLLFSNVIETGLLDWVFLCLFL